MDATTRALLHGAHLQVMGMQASLEALDHSLRTALRNREAEAPPSALVDAAEEIRRSVQGPTMEERRESVFMRGKNRPDVSETVASGTPNGEAPVPSAL